MATSMIQRIAQSQFPTALMLFVVMTAVFSGRATPNPVYIVGHPESAPQANMLDLQLSASRSSYMTGDDIRLRVAVVNHSTETVAVLATVAWDATQLLVLGDNNIRIVPSKPPVPFGWKFPSEKKITPGRVYAYQWFDDQSNTLTEYHPLSYWGYSSLKPGHYRIYAIAANVSFMRGKAWFRQRYERSNPVNIVVQSP